MLNEMILDMNGRADMGIEEEIRRWQDGECMETMRQGGFKAGDRVVDFGCGIGNYTFPLSRVVQEKGEVYAMRESGRGPRGPISAISA